MYCLSRLQCNLAAFFTYSNSGCLPRYIIGIAFAYERNGRCVKRFKSVIFPVMYSCAYDMDRVVKIEGRKKKRLNKIKKFKLSNLDTRADLVRRDGRLDHVGVQVSIGQGQLRIGPDVLHWCCLSITNTTQTASSFPVGDSQ